MKKFFILIVPLLLLLSSASVSAQVKFGVKGGVGYTDMSVDGDYDTGGSIGFFIGPTVRVSLPLGGLGVDASVLYDWRETKLSVLGGDTKRSVSEHSLAVPVNLRYDIGLIPSVSLYVAAGPQFNFAVGNRIHSFYNGSGGWRSASSAVSVNVGVGVMLSGQTQIGINYNIACGKSGEVIDAYGYGGDGAEGRINVLQASLAYYF